jgi:hypothetical protein
MVFHGKGINGITLCGLHHFGQSLFAGIMNNLFVALFAKQNRNPGPERFGNFVQGAKGGDNLSALNF